MIKYQFENLYLELQFHRSKGRRFFYRYSLYIDNKFFLKGTDYSPSVFIQSDHEKMAKDCLGMIFAKHGTKQMSEQYKGAIA